MRRQLEALCEAANDIESGLTEENTGFLYAFKAAIEAGEKALRYPERCEYCGATRSLRPDFEHNEDPSE